jgi:hypothetical protein
MCVHTHSGIVFGQKKKRSADIQEEVEGLENITLSKEACHKTPLSDWFCLHEMPYTWKPTDRSGWVVSSGQGQRVEIGGRWEVAQGLLEMMEMSKIDYGDGCTALWIYTKLYI